MTEPNEKFLSGPEAARYLKLGVSTFYRMLKEENKFKKYRITGKIFFLKQDLDDFLESMTPDM